RGRMDAEAEFCAHLQATWICAGRRDQYRQRPLRPPQAALVQAATELSRRRLRFCLHLPTEATGNRLAPRAGGGVSEGGWLCRRSMVRRGGCAAGRPRRRTRAPGVGEERTVTDVQPTVDLMVHVCDTLMRNDEWAALDRLLSTLHLCPGVRREVLLA